MTEQNTQNIFAGLNINASQVEAMRIEAEKLKLEREKLVSVWKPAYEQYQEIGKRLEVLNKQLKGIALLTSEKIQTGKSLAAMWESEVMSSEGEKRDKVFHFDAVVLYEIGKIILKRGSGEGAEWPETWIYVSKKSGETSKWKVDAPSRLKVAYPRYYFVRAMVKKMFVQGDTLMVTTADGTVKSVEDVEAQANQNVENMNKRNGRSK